MVEAAAEFDLAAARPQAGAVGREQLQRHQQRLRHALDTAGVAAQLVGAQQRVWFVLRVARAELELRRSAAERPGLRHQDLVVMRNNVSSANFWAIAKGAGIGALPTYAAALGSDVVPLNIANMQRRFDIYLTYHPDVSRSPRVRKLIDWLIKAFDSRRFPWFRDEFIHPNDLMQLYDGEPLINMFAGFVRMVKK